MRAEHWWYTLPLRLRSLFRRSTAEQELADELRDHVDRLTAQFQSRGLDAEQARTEALRAMGGLERRKEEMRSARQVAWLEHLLRDVQHAFRQLRSARVFTAVAIITLALGTGANTGIFTVVDGVLLRPLGYGHPDRLAVIEHRAMETAVPAEVLRWQADSLRSFAAIGAANVHSPTLTGRGDPEQISALYLTAGLLPLLQVRPLLGRVFTPDEAHDGRDRVAILSYGYWQRRLGGDPHVLGQTLVLDGVPHTVIGVMPAAFRFAPYWSTHADLWVPLSFDGLENDWDGASLRVFARLRPGVTIAQAQAEMTAVGARTRRSFPNADERLKVVSLQEKVTGSVKPELWLLAVAVLLVLLIACANVTHLQLMRTAAREREFAVRLSLGAGRARLVQQSLTESLLIALLGGTVGLLLATAGVRILAARAPDYIPRVDSVHINGAVFAFTLAVVIFTGVASGLIPALAAARVDPNQMLRSGGRGASDGARRQRLGALLVISEFAMAVILLTGAGLVLRSFARMIGVDPGFDPAHVTSFQVNVTGTQHDSASRRSPFFTELTNRIRVLPGVEAASAINHLPLHGDVWGFSLWTEAHPLATRDEQPHAWFRIVLPGYFAAMHVPILGGRDITQADVDHRAPVVVIDQTMARTNWPHGDAIGKRISVDDPSKGASWFTVIGVVHDVQQANWSGNHQSEMFYPYWRDGADREGSFTNLLDPHYMTYVVRARGTAASVVAAVRRVVAQLDADAPVADVISMDQARAEQIAEPSFYLMLFGGFAAIALILAAVGVYGVLSYAVASRAREFGIRMALGAPQGTPFRLAIDRGIRLALAGTVAGLLGAIMVTRYLRVLLYGVGPTDPVTFIAVAMLLLTVAAVACYLPARRASRVDPVTVLRAE